ncbi:hypothetical protein TIFTF001_035607 [Ficus carica]|uniref:Uncharacterized protein n=1 Tax=Ficus carica TaxID=3494 RepID=A0AA88EB41_FICCA|nr:hypothetical protein TIFTF001_035607 [Ficus carica]
MRAHSFVLAIRSAREGPNQRESFTRPARKVTASVSGPSGRAGSHASRSTVCPCSLDFNQQNLATRLANRFIQRFSPYVYVGPLRLTGVSCCFRSKLKKMRFGGGGGG